MDLALFLFQFPWVVGEERCWERLWCEMLDKERAKGTLLYCGVMWLKTGTLPWSAPPPPPTDRDSPYQVPGLDRDGHHHTRHWGAQNAACVLGSFFQHKFVQLCGKFGEDTHLVLQRGRKKKWDHTMNFSSSNAATVQNQFAAFKLHHLWSHIVFHDCTQKQNAFVCFCPMLWASCVWNFLKAERVQ